MRSCGGFRERSAEAMLLERNSFESQVVGSAIFEGGGEKREFGEIVIDFEEQRFLQARAGAAAGHRDLFSACTKLALRFADFRFGQVESEIGELLVRDGEPLSRLRARFIEGEGSPAGCEDSLEIPLGESTNSAREVRTSMASGASVTRIFEA